MPDADRRLVRERLAEEDIAEQAEYIGTNSSSQAALRFLDAVEAAMQQLCQMPESGTLWDFTDQRLAGTRVRPIAGFRKHLVFYQTSDDEVRILRVLHAARDVEQAFRRGD